VSLIALLAFVRALGLTLPLWIVAGWSTAEAVLWFIVADVPISWIAVRSGTRAGLLAALVAAGSAIVGGTITYQWASHDAAGATATIEHLPAISSALIGQAATQWSASGFMGMLLGSFSGTPYKLFALAAGTQGSPFPAFLIATFAARLPRYVVVALVAGTLSRLLSSRLSYRRRLVLLGVIWIIIYVQYFTVMA